MITLLKDLPGAMGALVIIATGRLVECFCVIYRFLLKLLTTKRNENRKSNP